ncbi:hypothetical protein CHS0354_022084 [Potamilus streckersoni]|uniref:Uncharacterized protein n=1 Tax=Potamilus streckersoni TaxID=2493646 RepID=A0AAE0W1K3_9BIVA|nr:hypothetical protein CHS0354_022084 [Potamilus streckersoni]
MVDFTRKFIEPDPSGFGEFEVTGRPLAGNTYKLVITVPRYDAVTSVDRVLVLLKDGTTLQTLLMTNVGGRRGASLFNTNITIPIQDFLIAIEGLDKTGHTFRRLDPKLIAPLALKLECKQMGRQYRVQDGNVYVNETYNVTYTVYNIGSTEADIDVMISDQDGLTPIPTAHSYTLQGRDNVTRQFLMRVGSEVGHVE